ncbi:MAG: phasin family protein [bacterium]
MRAEAGKDAKVVFSEFLKGGLENSRRTLTRLETEGEKLVRRIAKVSEKYVPESQRKQLDEWAAEAGRIYGEFQKVFEQNTRKMMERLNSPARNVGDQLRKNLDTRIERGLTKLSIARKADIEAVTEEVRGLKDDLAVVKAAVAKAKTAPKKKEQPAG